MALNDAWRTTKGYLSTIETPEGAGIVEAVSTRWKTVIVLKAVTMDEFI